MIKNYIQQPPGQAKEKNINLLKFGSTSHDQLNVFRHELKMMIEKVNDKKLYTTTNWVS